MLKIDVMGAEYKLKEAEKQQNYSTIQDNLLSKQIES
jgi:hypothetical protein